MRYLKSIFLLAAMVVACFQNCSNVRLTPVSSQVMSSYAKSGDICSLPSLSSTDKVKITFVVDMSSSNATTEKRNSSNQIIEFNGSDLNRQRMQTIRDFLAKECLKANDSTKIAVVGFAHQKIISPGTACDRNQFKPVDDYLTEGANDPLDFLESEHDLTKQDCVPGGGRCSEYITRYDEGMECAKQIVHDDMQAVDQDGKKAFYMTFFLTDGEPSIPGVVGYDISNPAYQAMKVTVKQKVRDMRNEAEEKALGLTLRPIFYGGDYLTRKDPTGEKEAIARDILTDIANEGLTEYIFLQDVSQLDLCKYLVSGTRVPYKLKQFVATNLTITKMGEKLLADSDMDGIPDELEGQRGFDPTKARSMGPSSQLLDGFCGGLNASQCANSIHQDCGSPNALGLTLCEVSKWGLTNGLDSDGDDFIDIMEVIKGMGPNIPSGYVDGDSSSEFEEMMRGRDPRFPDDDTPAEVLLQYRRWPLSKSLPGCPADQESYQFELDHVPLLPTLATNSDDPVSQKLPWMNHGENVNVLMVYYILTPANQALRQDLKDQVYIKYYKIHISKHLIEELGFLKAGELNDAFSEFAEEWK